MAGLAHGVFAILFLDAQNRLLAMEEMFSATLSQTSLYPRKVFKRAPHLQASAVVLTHNHPSGSVQVFGPDEMLAQTLKAALALVDTQVLDHSITCQLEALSMAERGLL
jgi:DNA repair protein RadC